MWCAIAIHAESEEGLARAGSRPKSAVRDCVAWHHFRPDPNVYTSACCTLVAGSLARLNEQPRAKHCLLTLFPCTYRFSSRPLALA